MQIDACTVTPPDEKTVATLVARAALAGIVLTVTTDDHGNPLYIASRWALTKQLGSVEEVELFLSRVGAPAA